MKDVDQHRLQQNLQDMRSTQRNGKFSCDMKEDFAFKTGRKKSPQQGYPFLSATGVLEGKRDQSGSPGGSKSSQGGKKLC